MNRLRNEGWKRGLWILAGIAVLGVFTALLAGPVPQDPAYHGFVDGRSFFGIPNALNVLSNLPFVMIGAVGLAHVLAQSPGEGYESRFEQGVLAAMCLGIVGIGFGSSYYHLLPDNGRLVWDRLPMAVVFSTLLVALIYERIDATWARRLLLPWLLLSVGTVWFWHWGELHGEGDLRPYAFVQFYTLVAGPLIYLLFPPRYTHGRDLLVAVAYYVLAKAAELLDGWIFERGIELSGHTLKHLFAGLAVAWLVRMVVRRRPLAQPS